MVGMQGIQKNFIDLTPGVLVVGFNNIVHGVTGYVRERSAFINAIQFGDEGFVHKVPFGGIDQGLPFG